MKIYVAHSREYDYKNELYKPILESKLYKKIEFILPHLLDKIFNSKEVINDSDLFIAEVSYPAIGLGIEIGRAEAANKKILFIHKDTAKVTSSLKYIKADTLIYSNDKDLIDKIDRYITENFMIKNW